MYLTIVFMFQIKDTKNTENTGTMLEFLAGIIDEQKDKRYSEVYGFIEELKHVPKAARG